MKFSLIKSMVFCQEIKLKIVSIVTRKRQLFSTLSHVLFSRKYGNQAIKSLSIKIFLKLFKDDTLENKT